MTTAGSQEAHSWWSRDAFVAVMLFAIPLLLYGRALGHPFLYDDTEVILASPPARTIGDVLRLFAEPHFYNLPYWRPLTRASLLLQRAWHGDDPAPFRLFNVLLFSSAGVLFHALLRTPAAGLSPLTRHAAALLFVVHPVCSAVVMPIASGRESLMPAVWIFASVLAFLHARIGVALVLFACALLSKEQAVVLPLMLLVVEGRSARIRRHAGFWALLVVYLLVRAWMFGGSELRAGTVTGPLWSLLYAAQVIVTPFVDVVYEPDVDAWLSPMRALTSVLVVAAVLGAIVRTRRRAAAVATLIGGISLLPTANLLRQETQFDERFVLIACAALIAAAAMLVSARTAHVAWLLAAACAAMTVGRTRYYSDEAVFLSQWVHTQPDSFNGNHMLGNLMLRQRRPAEALRAFSAVLARAPGDAVALAGATAARQMLGEPVDVDGLRAVLERSPAAFEAHAYLGEILVRAGREQEAIVAFEQTVRVRPNSSASRHKLGILLGRHARSDEAIAQLLAAQKLDPDNAEIAAALGYELHRSARVDEAIEQYRIATRLDAAHAYSLGMLLARSGRLQEAKAAMETAVSHDPNDPAAAAALEQLRQATGLGSP